jgi:LPS O-antigen subunit length determinant protein (WzzB/FepE family)
VLQIFKVLYGIEYWEQRKDQIDSSKSLIICVGTHIYMRANSIVIVGLLMLIAGIFLSYMLAQEEDGTIIINQPIVAQLGMPSDSILLNKTNMTTPTSPTITENITVTPAPEVNNTLIGRSTPTTSNNTLQFDNKTGEAESLGGIK